MARRSVVSGSSFSANRLAYFFFLTRCLLALAAVVGALPPAAEARAASPSASPPSQAPTPGPRPLTPDLQPPTPSPQSPPDGHWTLLNAPPARSQHTALWDSTGEQMLVFGGSGGSRTSEVWSYKPAADRWTQPATAVPARVGLAGQSAVWDPVRGQYLLYGGLGPGAGGDLWSFKPTSGAWVDLKPIGARPSSRAY